VEIVGGGLSGLALGLALRRADVPVTLHEAGNYPRHRVCGEFLRGLSAKTISTLQLAPLFAGARRHREIVWFEGDEPVRRQQLRSPALALSRHTLDLALADAFRAAGGQLFTGSRADLAPQPGRVLTCGRVTDARSPWLGLKLHARDLPLASGLELHLGRRAYVGLCELPDGAVNVCGLFHRTRTAPGATPLDRVLAHLRAAGLEALAQRLEKSSPAPESFSAVAGLVFVRARAGPGAVCLGDAAGMIPPFTGNGMAIALTSAALALPPLTAWSRRELSWLDAARAIDRALRSEFGPRLHLARMLHPMLLRPSAQRVIAQAAGERLLPLDTLARALS
jgi:flavin-dependent dehydrogenase